MKTSLFLGIVSLLLIGCDARVNTSAPGPDKVIEKTTIVTPAAEKTENKTVIVNPPAASTTEKTTTTTTETKK